MMEIIYYAIFAFASWFILMRIFRFSTYHRYFRYSLFFIIGYSVLNSYLLFYFEMHSFFLWHLPIFLVLFFKNYKNQKKIGTAFEHLIDNEKGLTKEFFELSLEKTLKYYIISALTYLIVFAVSYIYFFNTFTIR